MGTFSLGISEFLMMGILVELAGAMDVSVSRAGHFIASYAAGVCVGAPAMLLFRRMSLSRMLMYLAGLIALGNLLAAFAFDYWSLCAARFVSGLPHGAYFGVGAIVARRLAKPGQEVMAVSLMIAGMTVATLGGVPLGTFISTFLSWRVAFLIVAVSGVVTLLSIRRFVPFTPALPDKGFKDQFRFLKTLPPWLIFGGVLSGQLGLYCWYSYIDPQLTLVAGFSAADLTWLMVLAGFGMFVGNLVSGKMGEYLKPSAVSASVLATGIPILLAFYLFGDIKWAAVVLLFIGTMSLFGSGSPLQSSIVGYARGGELLGGACIQIAYNAGNAIAASVGGAVINYTHSYSAVCLSGIPFAALGTLLIFILYWRYERNGAVKGPKG